MRIARFECLGAARLGVVVGDEVADVTGTPGIPDLAELAA